MPLFRNRPCWRTAPPFALAALLSTCGGSSHPLENAPARVEAQAPRFDPAVARPAGPVGAARRHLREGNARAAERVLMEALPDANGALRGELLWLRADAQRMAGEDDLDTLEALAALDHPLSRHAELRLAARLSPGAVVARLGRLAEDDWAGRRQAALRVAKAYATLGIWDRALPLLRDLVEETPAHVGAASAAMPLAAYLREHEDPAAREEALGLYRRVATRAPRAAVGREARERAAAVLATLPEPRRDALRAIPADDRLFAARALAGSQHHRDAAEVFDALAAERPVGDPMRCEATLAAGSARLKLRGPGTRERRARVAPVLAALVGECADPDVRAWAGYRGARAYARSGASEEALATYAALAEAAPDHRLADDALFHRARLLRAAGDEAGARAAFEAVLREHPRGDMVGEAVFQLAAGDRAAGDPAGALRWLERGLALRAPETTEGIGGRLAYWRARSLEALGRADDAFAAYEDVVRREPLSFYAQLAIARLRAAAPGRAEALHAWLRDEPATAPLHFARRPELETPAFARALALLRVGATDEGERALRHQGFLGAGADPDALWLAAAVLAESGALPAAARIVRRRLGPAFRRALPRGTARALWRLAYPPAFSPLIEEAAAAAEVPASFLRAVAREESSFDPRAVSWAHAYGLVQVILPTARRFGEGLGVPITPRTLRRPEVNLAVGARYVRFLRERYAGQPGLVPGGYNAGEGAVDRWLRNAGTLAFDEYVEAIPYDETRRYTRRVLQSWAIYSYLDEGRLPEFSLGLPAPG
ncbi:MAG: transglycosylase SLT domain-containing protein [Myxococcota bacterium]